MQHPDPERLALAALPAEPPDPGLHAHLRECPECREHVEALRRTVELAVAGRGDGVDYDDPPERVRSAITDRLRAPRRRRVAVPLVAALLILVAGLGLGYAAGSARPAERPLAVLAAVDGGAATGSVAAVDEDGRRVLVVQTDGVLLPPGADHLEAWLTDAAAVRLVPLGALVADGVGYRGTFELPAGVPLAAFDRVDVSAERWDGDERHSRTSLLRGPLA